MENDWSEGHILKIVEGINDEFVINKMKNMPIKEREILTVLYNLYKNKLQKGLPLIISYEEIQYKTGLSFPSITGYINTFQYDYGLISTDYENKGRKGGNRRKIFFNEPYFNRLNNFMGQQILIR